MSRPVEYESGAPNVYQPQPTAAPAYEEYPDPAAAHGWQTAYDATAELPGSDPRERSPTTGSRAGRIPSAGPPGGGPRAAGAVGVRAGCSWPSVPSEPWERPR